MPVPDFQSLMLPALKALAGDDEVPISDVRQHVAAAALLTPEDMREMLPSGRQSVFMNRVSWAVMYLGRSGLTKRVRRGVWRVTRDGAKLLADPPPRIDMNYLRKYPAYVAWRTGKNASSSSGETVPSSLSDGATDTPEEALEKAARQLREVLEAEVLERVRQAAPDFLEKVVIDLLIAMGYGGGDATMGRVTGRSGDGGIDGTIRFTTTSWLTSGRPRQFSVMWQNIRCSIKALKGSLDETELPRLERELKTLQAVKRRHPAASYQILINDVPVSPRSASPGLADASFRNTLSAGDKSTLALALFLAKLNADPALGETIVVLDDPFTSLDNFRRQFTAIEIRKLCDRSAQTIVLSHDKTFLRLLWDKIDQGTIKCVAVQTGAPGMTTIAPYDIESETRPRHVTERMKIEEFVEGEPHETGYIRTRLRTVCEDFYRRGDPGLFHEAASLDEIGRLLQGAPEEHPYKGVIEDLRDINEYSRREHHAEVEDDPSGESSDEELKGFCRRVLDLTRGM